MASEESTRYRNTATMTVTIEVHTGSTWEGACSLDQVRAATIREAKKMLANKLGDSLVRIVGEPKVVMTQHAETT